MHLINFWYHDTAAKTITFSLINTWPRSDEGSSARKPFEKRKTEETKVGPCLAAIAVHRRINLFIALTSFPSFLKFIEFVAVPRQREMLPPSPMESYFERTIKQSGGANGGWYFAVVLYRAIGSRIFIIFECCRIHTLTLKFSELSLVSIFANIFLRKFFYSTQLRHRDIYLSKVNLLNFYILFLSVYYFSSNVFPMCAATGNVLQLSRREIK